ncbi:MAG: DUF3604 domain-containing protein [Myxococcota bacterium]
MAAMHRLVWLVIAGAVVLGGPTRADPPRRPDDSSSPEAAKVTPPSDPARQAYFGDLHLHTSYSLDSYIFGNRNDWRAAYRFAQGEPVTLHGGERLQLARPLDFVAITDHGEFLGEHALCTTPDGPRYETPVCQGIRAADMGEFVQLAASVTAGRRLPALCGEDGRLCAEAAGATWAGIREAAIRFDRPGRFTTLVGYEYSPNVPGSGIDGGYGGMGMIHRNVIFRTTDVPKTIFTAYDGPGEAMLEWLDGACRAPCRALTIPHNSNMSFGRFFWERRSDGTPWTPADLERRARLEPLVEIFQIKGSSECGAGIGFADEECGFETILEPCPPGRTEGCAMASSYVRDALVAGLRVERTRGINPFRLGFIGSTDNHNGTPGATDEAGFKGHLGQQDDTLRERVLPPPGGAPPEIARRDGQVSNYFRFNPGGLAAVWAERNTREAIFDALARRESFATSGTRILVRFFGGFELPADLHVRKDLVRIGYAKGVPMGGDLGASPAAQVGADTRADTDASAGARMRTARPRFVVWAARDPESAPIAKIQIVKGWSSAAGEGVEVHDVACAGGREPDPTSRRCPDGDAASIDPRSCRSGEAGGAAELAATWADPDFDPKARAVYYARVLERPVCRWSTHDAARLGVELPASAPRTIEERAWTSPIWYSPGQ